MKKLSLYIFLGLMWCNVGFAESTLSKCKGTIMSKEKNCYGSFEFSNGDTYTGEVQNGKSNGQGTYIFKEYGSKHVGEFKDNRPNGKVTSTYLNGDIYVGEQKDGLYHGKGTFTWASGNKYVGGWKDGKKHGQGTSTFPNGAKFTGNFIENQPNGIGTYVSLEGDSIQIKFENGKLDMNKEEFFKKFKKEIWNEILLLEIKKEWH